MSRAPASVLRRHAANLITLARIVLLFVVVTFAFAPSFGLRSAAVGLAVLVLAMDWADGVVARRLGVASRFGAVLDIVGDRLVEIVWWMSLANLGAVHLAVPLTVVTRGIVVDAIRALALGRGLTPFGERTMMRSPIGRLLVSSRVSRATYGVVKALAFPLLFAQNALELAAAEPLAAVALAVTRAAPYVVGLTVLLCVVRAAPVVIESRGLLEEP